MLLPWLPSPASHPAVSGGDTAGLPGYLNDAATLITARIRHLADVADRDRPAWMNLLGQPLPRTAGHQQWLSHIAVIAAYRDQHDITTDDPRQVLGPASDGQRYDAAGLQS